MSDEFYLGPPPPSSPQRPMTRPRRQKGWHVLFLAVTPPPGVAECVWRSAAERQRQFDLFGSLLKPENLHMSALCLGEFPVLTEDLIDLGMQIGSGAVAPPFEFTFNRTMSFKNTDRYPFVMTGDAGVAEFRALQQSIWTAAALGAKAPKSMPHMTLLWGDKLVPATPLEEPISFAVERSC